MAHQTNLLYEQTKNEIVQLFTSPKLCSVDGGLTLTELCREYCQRYENRSIPYQELGFETLSGLLRTMGNLIKLNYKEWPTKCYLIAKVNEEEKNEQSQEKLYEETRNRLVQLLTSSPLLSTEGGLTLTELCREYERCYGNAHIPHEELGFEKLGRLLRSMKDYLRMEYEETSIRLYLTSKVLEKEKQTRKNHNGSAQTYDAVKNEICSVLRSCENPANGLSFTELCDRFKARTNGHSVPYGNLGYATLTDFLQSMWDVLTVKGRQCYLAEYGKKFEKRKKGKTLR